MNPRTCRWALAMMAACTAVACGDRSPTEPQIPSSGAQVQSRAGKGDIVGLLKRTEPLKQRLTATAVIGPRGGRIQIARAGFEIDFPSGAVLVPTRITVTALSGSNVAYEFEPHGIVFNRPVTVNQNLHHTIAWKNPLLAAQLQGSYFERLIVDPSETFARSLEPRKGKLKNSQKSLEFTVEHFSGYMVSTGKNGADIDVDIDITSR